MPDSSNIPSTSSAISSLPGSANVDGDIIRKECLELIFRSILYVFMLYNEQLQKYEKKYEEKKFNCIDTNLHRREWFEKVWAEWAKKTDEIFEVCEENYKQWDDNIKRIGNFCFLNSFNDIICRFIAFIFFSDKKPKVNADILLFFSSQTKAKLEDVEALKKNFFEKFNDTDVSSIKLKRNEEEVLVFFSNFYELDFKLYDIDEYKRRIIELGLLEKFKLNVKKEEDNGKKDKRDLINSSEKRLFPIIHKFIFEESFLFFKSKTKTVMERDDFLREYIPIVNGIEKRIAKINEVFIKKMLQIRTVITINSEVYKKKFFNIHSEFFMINKVMSFFEEIINDNNDANLGGYNFGSSFPVLNNQPINYSGLNFDLNSSYSRTFNQIAAAPLNQTVAVGSFITNREDIDICRRLSEDNMYYIGKKENSLVRKKDGASHVKSNTNVKKTLLTRIEKRHSKFISMTIRRCVNDSETGIQRFIEELSDNSNNHLSDLFELQIELLNIKNELLIAYARICDRHYYKDREAVLKREIDTSRRIIQIKTCEKQTEVNNLENLLRRYIHEIKGLEKVCEERDEHIIYIDRNFFEAFKRLKEIKNFLEEHFLELKSTFEFEKEKRNFCNDDYENVSNTIIIAVRELKKLIKKREEETVEEISRLSDSKANLESELSELRRNQQIELENELETACSERAKINEQIGLLKVKNEELFGIFGMLEEEIQSKERRIKSLEEKKQELENELKLKKNEEDGTSTSISSNESLSTASEPAEEELNLEDFFSEARFFLNSILNNKKRDLNSYINLVSNHKVVSASLFIFLFFSLIIIFRVLRFMIKKIFGRVNKKKVVVNLKKK